MPTQRSFDSLLDALLFGSPPLRANPAIALLKTQKNLKAYLLAKNASNASVQLRLAGTPAGRRVVFGTIAMDAVPMPLWIERLNPGTNTKEGFLIEALGAEDWVVSTYIEDDDTYATGARVFQMRRGPDSLMQVARGATTPATDSQTQQFAEVVMGMLAIICAPMLTEVVDEKPPKRGMTRFSRIRMAEPWVDLDRYGIPKLGRASRPVYVADEILDEIKVLEGRIWYGLYQYEIADHRSTTLKLIDQQRRGIAGAMRFALSPLAAATAAEVAEHERAGMQQARELLVLPDFLTWFEWHDAVCGVPGQRFGALLQAIENEPGPSDARGLLFALPSDWTLNSASIVRIPMLTFNLHLKSTGLPLLEVVDISALMAAKEVNADRLGQFLLAILTFIGQPRMAEQADVGGKLERSLIDRARITKQLAPQVSMKEVRLIIDLPREVEEAAEVEATGLHAGGGIAPGGMPWHRVRMFWRWRLGRLEVVRPHTRGSVENGVSRRVTLLLHPDEGSKRATAA